MMVTLTRHGNLNDVKIVHGRCLGLISNEQLAALDSQTVLWRKIYTGPTISLSLVSDVNVRGKRLAIAMKKLNGIETFQNELFISDELDFVRMSNPDTKLVHFECLDQDVWISAREE